MFSRHIFSRLSFVLLVGFIGFAPGAATAQIPGGGGEPSKNRAAPAPIAALLQPYVDSHTIAGAVTLVATKDKVIDVEAVGYADLDTKRPMAANGMFLIASQTKAMTAAVLMMLVDEGKVNLEDPVEKYLPEFKGMKVKNEQMLGIRPALVPANHPMTIREILSHSSGLPTSSPLETVALSGGGQAMQQAALEKILGTSLKDRVSSYAKLPLNHQPGTFYEYSNVGINTAGRIVEVVSGEPYEKFMEERLFKPLGMTDSTFWPSAEQQQRLAVIYQQAADQSNLVKSQFGQLQIAEDQHEPGKHLHAPIPSGGLFSTAADVAKFCQMLLNKGTFQGQRILSEAAVEKMTTKETAPEIKTPYGFGLNVSANGYSHGGMFHTNMQIEPKDDLITVFLVQQAGKWPNGNPNVFAVFHEGARKIREQCEGH